MNEIIKRALKEDIGRGDITSDLLIPARKVKAILLAKAAGIFCGWPVAEQILKHEGIAYKQKVQDGEPLKKGQIIAELKGDARKILLIERTTLNFLQRMSGIATLTAKFVAAVKPTGTRILDTRKTTPGLRVLEKYAVLCGGGSNHRLGLDDMILVKDNHLKLVGSWQTAVSRLKHKPKNMKVEIEAENLKQVKEILKTGIADIILLDNMDDGVLRQAIKMIRQQGPKPLIEISGKVTLANVKKYAGLGADRISIGALTHSATALDISLEII